MKNFINNKLKLSTKFYSAIIGATPSKGARSPLLWNRAYKMLKKPYKMYPFDVDEKNLHNLIKYLKNDKYFIGGSVTAPYKEKVIKLLDGVSSESKKIGSVNTLIKNGNRIYGENTDFYGAMVSLREFKNKKNILILGCGGAGKSVILACFKTFKKSKFSIYNRNNNKVFSFLKRLKISSKVRNVKNLDNLENIDLIINTTSIGFDSWIKDKKNFKNLKFFSPLAKIGKPISSNMVNHKFLLKNLNIISKNNFDNLRFLARNNKASVFDIIYNPLLTKLLFQAKLCGMKIKNGFEMNLQQAIKSFMIVNKIKNKKKILKAMSKNG